VRTDHSICEIRQQTSPQRLGFIRLFIQERAKLLDIVRREHLYPATSLILHTLALDVVYTTNCHICNIVADVQIVKRHGKVCAVSTKPRRGLVSPPPFPQSAFGYSEKWLRILLRAAPRDPIETLKSRAHKRTDLGIYMRRCSFNKRLRSRVSDGAVAHLSGLMLPSEPSAHANHGASTRGRTQA
jgi:hypothetical protein